MFEGRRQFLLDVTLWSRLFPSLSSKEEACSRSSLVKSWDTGQSTFYNYGTQVSESQVQVNLSSAFSLFFSLKFQKVKSRSISFLHSLFSPLTISQSAMVIILEVSAFFSFPGSLSCPKIRPTLPCFSFSTSVQSLIRKMTLRGTGEPSASQMRDSKARHQLQCATRPHPSYDELWTMSSGSVHLTASLNMCGHVRPSSGMKSPENNKITNPRCSKTLILKCAYFFIPSAAAEPETKEQVLSLQIFGSILYSDGITACSQK